MKKLTLIVITMLVLIAVPATAGSKSLVPATAEGIYIAATNLDKGAEGVAWAFTHPVESAEGFGKGMTIAGESVVDTTLYLADGTAKGLYTAATNLDKGAGGVAWAFTHPLEATDGAIKGIGKAAGSILKCLFGSK